MHNQVYASVKIYPKGRGTEVQGILNNLNYPNSMLCKQKKLLVLYKLRIVFV